MCPTNPKMVAMFLILVPFAPARGNPFRDVERWSSSMQRQAASYVRYVQDRVQPVPGLNVIQQDALNILHGSAQVEKALLVAPRASHVARRMRFPVRDLKRMVENAQRNIRIMEAEFRHHALIEPISPRSNIRMDRGITIHVDRHGVHPVPYVNCHAKDPQVRAQLRVLQTKLSAMQKSLDRLDKALWAM
ncbi:MAG: hypothetical protein JW829_13075 [Pirellulales bacterium]|nr:hypothetical protein [Pirellulales bacterium]